MHYTLIIFDLDGTLIESYLERGQAPRPFADVTPLPGRKPALRVLMSTGVQLGIATNQRGVAFGYNTADQVAQKLERVCATLGLPPTIPIAFCTHDRRGHAPYNDPIQADRAKPSPSMLREIMEHYGYDWGTMAACASVLMVGDRPEDQEAAHLAGVDYQDAAAFFAAYTV